MVISMLLWCHVKAVTTQLSKYSPITEKQKLSWNWNINFLSQGYSVFISFDALRNILHRWVMSHVNSFYCMYIQMDQVWMQDCFYLQSKAELYVHIFSASSRKCLLCFH